MSETILLTGFGPFGEHARNPSGEGARLLDQRPLAAEGFQVVACELPVELERASAQLAELIEEHAPAAVIASGIHSEPGGPFRLELLARNELHYEIPDIAGNLRRGEPVEEGGPAQVVSTLPLAKLKLALEAAGFPTELSEDAGRYLCNAVFYRVARQDCPAGFLHVPPTASPEEVARALTTAAEVTAGRLLEQRVVEAVL